MSGSTEVQASMDFCDGFIRGYNDCSEGVPHKNGTDAYNRGYNTQYESQVIAEKQSQIDLRGGL